MRELTNPKLIVLKGVLFLLAGLFAAILLVLDNPRPRTVGLVAIVAWCAARLYYFAFFVVERYVDPSYRFTGVWSLIRHVMSRRRRNGRE